MGSLVRGVWDPKWNWGVPIKIKQINNEFVPPDFVCELIGTWGVSVGCVILSGIEVCVNPTAPIWVSRGFDPVCRLFAWFIPLAPNQSSFLICTHLSEPGLIFSGRGRHPLDSKQLFAGFTDMCDSYRTKSCLESSGCRPRPLNINPGSLKWVQMRNVL